MLLMILCYLSRTTLCDDKIISFELNQFDFYMKLKLA